MYSFVRLWRSLEGPFLGGVFRSWYLLGAGVLCDGLGALTDGVLGQLTREKQTDGGLDLPARDG